MENDPFIDDFPIKTSIYKGFSMAMLNNQMVTKNWMKGNLYFPVEDIAIDHQVFSCTSLVIDHSDHSVHKVGQLDTPYFDGQ